MATDSNEPIVVLGREPSAAERRRAQPAHLQLTKEQITAALKENARLLAESNSPYVVQSPQERARVRGIREEQDWRVALAELDRALAQQRHSKRRKGLHVQQLQILRANAAGHLAEALAAQGRFDEAAEHAPDTTRAAELRTLWHAVMRPDEDVCGADCQEKFSNDPTLLTKERAVQEVFSLKHNKVMPVIACGVCGRQRRPWCWRGPG
jgi:hypothetical protein